MKEFIKFAIAVQVLTFVVGLCLIPFFGFEGHKFATVHIIVLITTIAVPFAAFAFAWWME